MGGGLILLDEFSFWGTAGKIGPQPGKFGAPYYTHRGGNKVWAKNGGNGVYKPFPGGTGFPPWG